MSVGRTYSKMLFGHQVAEPEVAKRRQKLIDLMTLRSPVLRS